jgi:tetratricopeptide (TPR) repeat protein
MYREVLDASLRTMGRADRSTLTTQRWLAGFLASQRRYPEAETLLREALKAAVEKYGPEHGDTSIRLMCALADVLAQQRKDAEAEQVARQVLEFQHRQRPRPPPTELRQSSSALIGVLLRRGANDEALRIEREMIEFLLESSGGPEVSAARLDRMARTLLDPANKQLRDAPQALGLALQASERSGRKNPNFLNTLARAYLLAGYSGDAATVWEEAIALLPDDPARAQTLNRAAWELLTVTPESARDPAKAVEFALRANELSDYKNPGYVGTLARAYLLMGDAARATELWEQASALQPDDKSRAAMLNEAAWDLLTVTPESFRDPAAAMTFTLRSNELSGYQNPVYLDSLALACFRTGATIKAIEVQKQALELMAHDASERSEYEARLAEYEAALAAQSASGPSPP